MPRPRRPPNLAMAAPPGLGRRGFLPRPRPSPAPSLPSAWREAFSQAAVCRLREGEGAGRASGWEAQGKGVAGVALATVGTGGSRRGCLGNGVGGRGVILPGNGGGWVKGELCFAQRGNLQSALMGLGVDGMWLPKGERGSFEAGRAIEDGEEGEGGLPEVQLPGVDSPERLFG